MDTANETLIKANQEELFRFEQVYHLTTEPSFFLFQYDTDLVQIACKAKVDEIINPKQTCVLDCSVIKTDNLLVEIHRVIKNNDCHLIHIINIEQAAEKHPAFLLKLNTERENIFRNIPVHLVFWTNQFTTNLLQKKAFDFWSWIVFIFMIETPQTYLTERQKSFTNKLELEDIYHIEITAKDPNSRLQELDRQWQIIVNKKAKHSIKELKDCFSITKLYANELSENGNYTETKKVLTVAIELLENTELTDELNILSNDLALVYQFLGNLQLAKELLEKALKTNVGKFGDLHPTVAINQSNLASVYKDLGDLVQAKKLLESALENNIKNLGIFHPTVAINQSVLALIYHDLGNLQQAKILLEKALENDIKNFGDKHPTVAIRQSNLATVYQDLGNLQKAKELLEKALENDIINFGDKHPTVAIRQSNLAMVYKDLGDLQQAKKLLEKAYTTLKKNLGIEHSNSKTVKGNLYTVISEIKILKT